MAILAAEWHRGEVEMHKLLKVPLQDYPTAQGFPPRYAARLLHSPLVALGTLDDEGNPWTTVWGGERGFSRQLAEDIIALNSGVSAATDPVFRALWGDEKGDGIVKTNRMMSALAIDLETRDRVKLAGVMVAGALVGQDTVQMAMHVTESLGNCPKYLNKKAVEPHSVAGAKVVSDSLPLSPEALRVIQKADLFFLSSTNGETMDTNHRGGSPGFVRVLESEGNLALVYPEFSGNRLYQTLGNLRVNPKVGIVVPDFETGDVLYLTGESSILIGDDASAVLAKSKLAVKITVTKGRFVRAGLPFRASVIDYSPYNPPLRYLTSEKPALSSSSSKTETAPMTAHLVNREVLTPNVSRFTLKMESLGNGDGGGNAVKWQPGQHLTLDFSGELDHGWAHMDDGDPQSLNDDHVRTFTVSSAPDAERWGRLEITARRNGAATGFLWRHNLRVPLGIPAMGFGGEEGFRLPTSYGEGKGDKRPVFVAGGVGITPLLAQARGVLDAGVPLRVIWTLRGEDVGLAADSFRRIAGLAGVTRLFLTGEATTAEGEEVPADDELRGMGARVERRRLGRDDVVGGEGGNRFYLCASPGLMARLNGWLEGEDVVSEDFGY